MEQTQEQPQEPAWLRSYKSRAAPFSSTVTKPSQPTPTRPNPAEDSQELKPTIEAPSAPVEEQPNTLSMSFPSTISLGLKSFGQQEKAKPDAAIHPALRDDFEGDAHYQGTSDSASTSTKVETVHKEQLYEKGKEGGEKKWRTLTRAWLQKLGCGRD